MAKAVGLFKASKIEKPITQDEKNYESHFWNCQPSESKLTTACMFPCYTWISAAVLKTHLVRVKSALEITARTGHTEMKVRHFSLTSSRRHGTLRLLMKTPQPQRFRQQRIISRSFFKTRDQMNWTTVTVTEVNRSTAFKSSTSCTALKRPPVDGSSYGDLQNPNIRCYCLTRKSMCLSASDLEPQKYRQKNRNSCPSLRS